MFRSTVLPAVFSVFCAIFCACAAPQPPKPATSQIPQAEEAAIAAVIQKIESSREDYKISPADLLEITVFQEKDLERRLRVSQNGTISFPLIGTVKVGGLSLIQAEETLATQLQAYLKSPQVTVFIREYGNKKVYVLGEVSKPGSYDLPPESHLTVLEAVSLAGGFTQIASKDRTRVIRTTPDGKSVTLTVEVSAITHRGEKQKDLPLEPNDVVYVPQSFF